MEGDLPTTSSDEAAGTVSQADPGTGRILRTVKVGSVAAGPDPLEERFGLAFDGNTVWVARLHTEVVRLDWAAGKVAGRFTIGLPGSSSYDVIAAGSGVAVTHDNANDADHLPGAVVVGDGAVWVFAGGGLLQRIDPVGNQVVHTLAVGPDGVDSGRLAVGAGSVWLSDAEARTLIRIDTGG